MSVTSIAPPPGSPPLRSRVRDLEREVAYLRAKLDKVIPVFQEARDALTALTMVQVLQNNIATDLDKRCDAAGTWGREDFERENP